MSEILLSILIPGIPSRFSKLKNLICEFQRQIGSDSRVEVLSLIDNKKRSIGMKREALVQASIGRFVAFCDDDDRPRHDYVSELVNAAESNPNVDVIVFNQRAILDGIGFDVRFGLEYENEQANGVQDILRKPFHVCAWRSDLAKKYHFPDSMYGEDWEWAKQLVEEAKTQHRIEKVLHEYRFDSKLSEAK